MSGEYWLLAGGAGHNPGYLISTHKAEAQVYGQATVMQQTVFRPISRRSLFVKEKNGKFLGEKRKNSKQAEDTFSKLLASERDAGDFCMCRTESKIPTGITLESTLESKLHIWSGDAKRQPADRTVSEDVFTFLSYLVQRQPQLKLILGAALHNIIYADEKNANIVLDYFQGSLGDKTLPVGAAVIKKCFVLFRLADPFPQCATLTTITRYYRLYYILDFQTAKCTQS